MKSINKVENADLFSTWNSLKKRKIKLVKDLKEQLQERMKRSVEYNNTHKKKRLRKLNEKVLVDYNVVSMFESTLSRTIGIKTDELTKDLVVIKTYYFQILEDIMLNGFLWDNKKFKYFTASAGQTRVKKSVFIKEKVYNKYYNTFMCGLSIDEINKRGGVNSNKYNAYLALLNSSTDVWEDFNVSKSIVIDDFETEVNGVVDFIDSTTYSIERKEMNVPINHTDGAGMFLPKLGKRTCIVRGPWLKGLLVPFEFDKWIIENNGNSKIKDIYGKEYDIFNDDIQVIFTKSQFKMWNYYSSWQEYVKLFNKYNCEIGYCKEEENYIQDSVINYQELQTLNMMTDREVQKISARSNQRIQNICKNIDTMLNVFGATKKSSHKSPYQKALMLYPELLQDIYSRQTLKEIKDSLVKSYRSGRLEIEGKYLFLIPDLFAACEYWFKENSLPNGLLKNGEVYTSIYDNEQEIDLLRSPHLFFEHSIRVNSKSELTNKWFISKGIYTSTQDLISKVLQHDNDGDTSLSVIDSTIIECAKRHLQEYSVVPLYYEMGKAPPQQLNTKTMYEGLIASYTAPSIGEISNKICKIWNRTNFDEECLNTIKLLVLQNNFSIDYAKTLVFPEAPKEVAEKIKLYTKDKLPHFFIHLKDKNKTIEQVEKNNRSTVNRLEKEIRNINVKFPKTRLDKFDYRILMFNPKIKIDEELVRTYYNLNCTYHYKVNHKDPDDDNISYIAKTIKEELSSFNYSDVEIADMLIYYLYNKNSRGKASLWFCYGDIIVQNIKANLNNLFIVCKECGKRFIATSGLETLCSNCKEYYSNVKMIKCMDCGTEFAHDRNTTPPLRCPICNDMLNKFKKREWKRKK